MELPSGLFLVRGCTNALQWGLEAPPEADFEGFGSALIHQGFSDRTEHLWMRLFVHPDKHQIVLIPKTKRIQIRVHYLTDFERRPVVACQLAQGLLAALCPNPDSLPCETPTSSST